MNLFAALTTDVGRERTLNEDSARIVTMGPDEHLLIVCDGMGGHEGGEVASATAVEYIESSLAVASPNHDVICKALAGAHAAVRAEAEARRMPSMGTTAVVAWVIGQRAWVAWVGDSRFYRLRGRERLRSQDHTRVARMVEMGILTPEQAKDHPEAHILTQAIGGGPGIREPFKPGGWAEGLALQAGDVLLLCSDGLYDLVDEAELAEAVAGLDVVDAGRRLVAMANERGGHDNITVIVGCMGSRVIPALPAMPAEGGRNPAASRTFDPDAIPEPSGPLPSPAAEPEEPPAQAGPAAAPRSAAPPPSAPPAPALHAPGPAPQTAAPSPAAPPESSPTVSRNMAAALVLATFLIGCFVGWQAHAHLGTTGHEDSAPKKR